jgi:hypothetical protein
MWWLTGERPQDLFTFRSSSCNVLIAGRTLLAIWPELKGAVMATKAKSKTTKKPAAKKPAKKATKKK